MLTLAKVEAIDRGHQPAEKFTVVPGCCSNSWTASFICLCQSNCFVLRYPLKSNKQQQRVNLPDDHLLTLHTSLDWPLAGDTEH